MAWHDLGRLHPALPTLGEALASGRLGRRGFVRLAARLGLSAGVAWALAGSLGGRPPVPAARAQEDGTPVPGGTLRVSMDVQEISDPATFDWSQKGNLARLVIEPLCRVGADNIARPHLARRWEVSEDLRVWTFHLRPDVRWSNGDAFIADDVIFNVERWLDPATGSSNLGRFSALTEEAGGRTRMREGAVERLDDLTVRFNLSRPDVALPENLGDYPALLVHRGFERAGGSFMESPVGTGPYRLDEIAVGERAAYSRREPGAWWGGDALLDRIVFISHGQDPSASLAALASRQVDLLFRLDVEQVPAVRNIPGVALHETITGSTGVARMKVTEAPFSEPRIRQAIRACIDHQRVLDLAFQGLGAPGEDHHVSPVHPEYAEIPPPVQDYERARALLAEAGIEDGLDLTLNCVNHPTWEQNACQVLKEMLAPAGIRVAINVLPGAVYWDSWDRFPFGFTSWAHRPLGVQTLSLAYRTGAVWNESSYSNPMFDDLLARASGTIDLEERRALMAQLQGILQEDSVIVQPFWRSAFTAGTERLRGFEIHPAEELHLEQAWLAPA